MIGVLALRSHGRDRRFGLVAAAGAVVPVAALLAFSLVPRGTSLSSPGVPKAVVVQREALARFEQALAPLVDEGAATVVYGMRPGIADVANGRLPDETLVTMAEGWVRATEGVREQFGRVAVPAFLGEAARLYRDSFDEYVQTARSLLAAARAGGEERSALVGAAAEHGTLADDLFEEAEAEVARQRDRLGIGEAG